MACWLRPDNPAGSHRWRLRQAADPCATTRHALPSSGVTNYDSVDLTQGTGLTPLVAAAVGIVVMAILDDIGSFAGRQGT
jgi:hypothetical protein